MRPSLNLRWWKKYSAEPKQAQLFILVFGCDDWEDDIAKGLIGKLFRVDSRGGDLLGSRWYDANQSEQPARADRKIWTRHRNWAARSYYQALISEDASHFYEDDFEGLGRVELRVLPGKDYPKRVAMVRSSGMKIYDKGHFQTPLRFAGVFVAKGEKLNALLNRWSRPATINGRTNGPMTPRMRR